MKILAIRGKNLASIEGRFEINFECEPFLSAGIFAITGPTGAGKSTLLDAMCLALFDRTPRMNGTREVNVSINDTVDSKISLTDTRSILRKGCSDCYAETDFKGIDGRKYGALWSVKRARGKASGQLQKVFMDIKDLTTGLSIAEGTKTETLKKIEQLLGMTFDQFTRAVLLAQNDFSTFLKASQNEKADLLEKLTGTDIYSKISQKIYEKTSEALNSLNEIKILSENVILLSDDEILRIKDEKRDLINDAELTEKELSLIDKKIKWINDFNVLNDAFKSAELYVTDCQTFMNESKKRFDFLDKIERVQDATILLVEKKNIFKDLQENIESKISSEFALNRTNELLIIEENKLKSVKAEIDESNVALKKLQPEFKIAASLDNEIKSTTVKLEEQRIDFENSVSECNKCENITKDLKSKIDVLALKLSDIEKWLTINDKHILMALNKEILMKYLSDASELNVVIEDNNNKIRDFSKDKSSFESLYNEYAKKIDASLVAIKANKDALDVIKKTIDDVDIEQIKISVSAFQKKQYELSKAKQCRMDIIAAENAKLKLANDYDNFIVLLNNLNCRYSKNELLYEKAVVKLEATKSVLGKAKLAVASDVIQLRDNLTENEPCPVCGSKEHPYVKNGGYKGDSALKIIENEYDEYLKEVQGYDLNLSKLKLEITNNKSLIVNTKDKLNDCDSIILLKNSEWLYFNGKFDGCLDFFNMDDTVRWFDSHEKNLSDEIVALNIKERLYNDLTSQYISISAVLAENERSLSEISESFSVLKNKMSSIEIVINNANLSNIKYRGDLNSALNHAAEKMGKPLESWRKRWLDEKDLFIKNIEDFAKTYNISIGEKTRLIEELELLKSEFARFNERIAILKTDELLFSERFHASVMLLTVLKEKRAQILEGKSVDYVESEYNSKLDSLMFEAEKYDLSVKNLIAEKNKLSGIVGQIENNQIKIDKLFLQKSNILAKWINNYNLKYAESLTEEELDILLQYDNKWIFEERNFKDSVNNNLSKALVTLEERNNNLLKHDIDDIKPDENEDENILILTKSELTEKKKNIFEKMSDINAVLKLQVDNRLKLQTFSDELKNREQYFSNWEKLNSLIGSAGGDSFRKKAQSFTLEALLVYANMHLKSLTDRYSLQQIPDSLSLQIIDHDMAEEIRTIYSLSGGETFLVSLALALGLSTLSSNKMNIESLFIDEGFGSLDTQTLGVAMDALERLHNHGRKVGVISHVQELTERIYTQVRILKVSGNKSSITFFPQVQ